MSDLGDLPKERLVELLRDLGVEARHVEELSPFGVCSARPEDLPDGARSWLRPDHPRIDELRAAYAGHPASQHVVWGSDRIQAGVDFPFFRADNLFLWQSRALAIEMRYVLTAEYVRQHDSLGLHELLSDDGLFGAHTTAIDGWTVSRDVLDSILQIDFLARTIGIQRTSSLVWLDIGAGYGRLAHRAVQALANLRRFICSDAVPESTFFCEYYLRFRGLEPKAIAVPLDAIDQALDSETAHLATNIHSFSECLLPAIEWWLDLLERHSVRYLMIEPNERDVSGDLTCLAGPEGPFVSFLGAIEARGYRRIALSPKYHASAIVQKHGLYATHYHLFERVADAV